MNYVILKNKKIIILSIIFILLLGIKLFSYIIEPRGEEFSPQIASWLEKDFSKFVKKSKDKSSSVGIANPSSVYCIDLEYKLGGGDGGTCVFPDGSGCDAWDFYTGKCGQEFTSCGQLGIKVENDTTTGDGYSSTRAVCVFSDGKCGEQNFAKVRPFFEGLELHKKTKGVCSIKVPQTINLTIIKIHSNPISGSEYTEIRLPVGFCLDSYPAGTKGYYLVQLDGFMHQDRREKIESLGGVIYDSIPEYAFIVKMDEETKNKIQKLEFVKWVGIYHPVYKMKPSLIYMLFE